MDHDNDADAELERLLQRTSASALQALRARIDVTRRLAELHGHDPKSEPTDDIRE